VGDDPHTILIDERTGDQVNKLGGHADFSFAVAWHPNGNLLATGVCAVWRVHVRVGVQRGEDSPAPCAQTMLFYWAVQSQHVPLLLLSLAGL
jgi:hypothetical protein